MTLSLNLGIGTSRTVAGRRVDQLRCSTVPARCAPRRQEQLLRRGLAWHLDARRQGDGGRFAAATARTHQPTAGQIAELHEPGNRPGRHLALAFTRRHSATNNVDAGPSAGRLPKPIAFLVSGHSGEPRAAERSCSVTARAQTTKNAGNRGASMRSGPPSLVCAPEGAWAFEKQLLPGLDGCERGLRPSVASRSLHAGRSINPRIRANTGRTAGGHTHHADHGVHQAVNELVNLGLCRLTAALQMSVPKRASREYASARSYTTRAAPASSARRARQDSIDFQTTESRHRRPSICIWPIVKPNRPGPAAPLLGKRLVRDSAHDRPERERRGCGSAAGRRSR